MKDASGPRGLFVPWWRAEVSSEREPSAPRCRGRGLARSIGGAGFLDRLLLFEIRAGLLIDDAHR